MWYKMLFMPIYYCKKVKNICVSFKNVFLTFFSLSLYERERERKIDDIHVHVIQSQNYAFYAKRKVKIHTSETVLF
jgi:hypothetical protein